MYTMMHLKQFGTRYSSTSCSNSKTFLKLFFHYNHLGHVFVKAEYQVFTHTSSLGEYKDNFTLESVANKGTADIVLR